MFNVRVLLADDHTLVRAGFRSVLAQLGVQITGEASDGREAIRLIEQEKPDLVFMDISMPGLNGLEALSYISKSFPDVKVVILSAHAGEEYILQALRAGAKGYLLKESHPGEFTLAIQTVMRGDVYLTRLVADEFADYLQRVGQTVNPLDKLTPRQRQVLQLLAEGRTTQDIAGILYVSPKTVETHRSELMERLDIYDIPGLVRFAVRVGLVSSDR